MRPYRFLLLAIVVMAILALAGCVKQPCKDCCIIDAIDHSLSYQANIKRAAWCAAQETGSARPGWETILLFDYDVQIMNDGPPNAAGSALAADILHKCDADTDHKGTRPAVVWTRIVACVKASTCHDIRIRVYSDQDNDDDTPESWAAIRTAAAALAKDARVKDVALVGADDSSQSWTRMAAALSALKSRLRCLPASAINANALAGPH